MINMGCYDRSAIWADAWAKYCWPSDSLRLIGASGIMPYGR